MKAITLQRTESPYWVVWQVYRSKPSFYGQGLGPQVALLHATRMGNWKAMEDLEIRIAQDIAPSLILKNGETYLGFEGSDRGTTEPPN